MHIWASLLLLFAALWIMALELPVITVLSNLSLDAYQIRSPRRYRAAPVKIIDIDDESLNRIGQWPWPRTLMAEMTDRLNHMGASVIAFDMVFAEPDQTSPAALARNWPNHEKIAALVKELPDHDRIFAQAIQRATVVIGFPCSLTPALDGPPSPKARFVTAGDDPLPFLTPFPGAIGNLSMLEAAAKGNGAFTYIPDMDGVIRRAPLMLRMRDSLFPALAVEALRVARNASNIVVKSSGASGENRFGGQTGIVNVRIGDLRIPTDPSGNIWLHYTRSEPDRYIPAWQVLSGEVAPERVAGQILFVGTSAKGLADLRFSPVSGLIPGVEVHAQMAEQLIQGSHILRPDWARATVALFLTSMWILLSILSGRVGPKGLAFIAVLGITLTFTLSFVAFTRAKFFVDPLFPSFVLAAMYIVCGFIRFLQAERERRWIRKAFSSYISPNLVEHLLKHPDQLHLGGEKRVCSFVLTDLAGFTAFMEKTEPSTVARVLNTYIEEMLQIAFRFDATLDRIMGDSIALMFSAPVTQPDHARRAVSCALALDNFSQSFVKATRAEGIRLGRTRIGVHTGTVLVGNFGGKSMFDFRALGDPINTCARLETVNKHLGTRVCVSRQTADMCENFNGRPAGNLILKGKTRSVEAFEPIGDGVNRDSPGISAYLDAYRMLERGEPEAAEAFSALVQNFPNDPLAKFHLKRLLRGESGVTVTLAEK